MKYTCEVMRFTNSIYWFYLGICVFGMFKDDEYACMKYCLAVTVYFSMVKFWGYIWPVSVICVQYQCKHIRNSSSMKCNNSPQFQCISAGWNFEVMYDQWVWYMRNISVNISEIVLQRNVVTAHNSSVFQQGEILRLYMTIECDICAISV